jgi:hypothetical protein
MANITIKNARLSFENVFKKAVFEGKEGKYEATLLFPKSDTATYDKIMDAIEAAKKAAKVAKIPDSKLCIKDGDEFEYDGYAGMWAVKAGNTKRPTVLNRDKTPLVEEDEVIYSGCYVNGIINIWIQNNQYGKRANANLLGIQFSKDGEPFSDGAKVADADEFDEVEDEF